MFSYFHFIFNSINSGLVPSIDVVIVRKFSMLYVETQGENKIVRNEQEEFEAMEQYKNVCFPFNFPLLLPQTFY